MSTNPPMPFSNDLIPITFSNDVIQKAEHIFHIIVKSAKLVCDKSAVVVKFHIKYSIDRYRITVT